MGGRKEGYVGRSACFENGDARTDIGGLDHAHVVTAISDAADALLSEASD
jgi:hypothetical protein